MTSFWNSIVVLGIVTASLAGRADTVVPAQFIPATSYQFGGAPQAVALADVNGDGRLDLIIGDLYSNAVSVRLGNGDGTFSDPAYYPTVHQPQAVVAGDLNGDGRCDFVVANNSANSITVFTNQGNGTFAVAETDMVGHTPYAIAIGDFNGDAKPDLAVANFDGNSVSVLTNRGNASFSTVAEYGMQGDRVSFVITADFNGDGKLDLAAANFYGNRVNIRLGNGDGTFGPDNYFTIGNGSYPLWLAAGDFDRDGHMDLVTADWGIDAVTILRGNGDGTFVVATNYPVDGSPASVAVADFNRDGKLDIVTADQGGHDVEVLTGNGDGSFNAAVQFAAQDYPSYLALGDLNGDGQTDIATANGLNSVSIFINQTFPTLQIDRSGTGLVLSWFNNDGFSLESSTNVLLATSWCPVTNMPFMFGNRSYVTDIPAESSRYFRLKK